MIMLERKKSRTTRDRAVVQEPKSEGRAGPGPDPVLGVLAGVMTLVGIVVIFDAGFARSIQTGDGIIPTEFRSQLIFALFAGLVSWGVSRVQGVVWQRLAPVLFGLAFAGLLLVKVIGLELNGAQRWIKVGPLTIQPAEFMKVATIVFVASVLASRKPWKHAKTRDWASYADKVVLPKLGRMIPMFLILAAVVCIEMEPDLGTAAVIGATGYFMFMFGGITHKSKIAVSLIALLIVGGLVAKSPFRMERVTNHVHRWEADRIDDVGYQTVQSEIAMASGGWTGVGIGAGRVKHLMPAATTDFVFATVAEEVGFLGVMGILALMGAVVWRIWNLAQRCTNKFAENVCFGVAIWLSIQATVNLMMANGLLPPIGIPFPFISSGGSSLLAVLIGIGLCQSVASMKEGASIEVNRHRRRNGRARLSSARNR